MPFPLPEDPIFRKEVIWAWITDVDDRLEQDPSGAELSWGIARKLYLSLPPGNGDDQIETALVNARVKLDSIT